MDTLRVRLLQKAIDEERCKIEGALQGVLAQPCADDNELASNYENTHAVIMFMQRAQERFSYLTHQMEIIESNPHMLCEECGEEIAQQRLIAVPDAVRCAECQMEWEEEKEERLRSLPFRSEWHEAMSYHP